MHLSTRYVGALSGFVDPRTPLPCISTTSIPERRLWVYWAKNERLIGLDLLVSLAIGICLRCVLDRVRPLGDLDPTVV